MKDPADLRSDADAALAGQVTQKGVHQRRRVQLGQDVLHGRLLAGAGHLGLGQEGRKLRDLLHGIGEGVQRPGHRFHRIVPGGQVHQGLGVSFGHNTHWRSPNC